MNKLVNNRIEMLNRSLGFRTESGLVLKPAAVALFDEVETTRDALLTLAADQESGNGAFHAGVDDRERASKLLRERLTEIAAMARSLDPTQIPAVSELQRVTESQSYQSLRANGQAFVEAVTPIQQAFVDREFPVGFVAEIATLTAALDDAGSRKFGGLMEQVEGTAGLDLLAKRGARLVRQLDAILTKMLKNSNPALLAAWKTASHVERKAKGKAEEVVPVEAPSI